MAQRETKSAMIKSARSTCNGQQLSQLWFYSDHPALIVNVVGGSGPLGDNLFFDISLDKMTLAVISGSADKRVLYRRCPIYALPRLVAEVLW